MKYVIFSKLNKNHFLFLSFIIIKIIDELCHNYMEKVDDIIRIFHHNYIGSLSDFLSIIPFIIIKIRSKDISKNELKKENIKEKEQDSNNNIEYIYSDQKTENNIKRAKRIFKFLIIVSIFDFLACYLDIIFKIIKIFTKDNLLINKVENNSSILFSIISMYVLSILILHSPFYRHHYVSMAINLLLLIILIILDIINIVNRKLSYIYVIEKTIIIILYSFEDVLAKILLSVDSVSPYIYLLYRGILVNILAFLFSFVFIFVKIPDENGDKSCVFSRFWKIYEYKLNILFYIIMFFNEYFMHLNIFLIIDKFSPIHFAMASIISYFISSLFSIFLSENDKISNFFYKLGIYLVLIVTSLIYNEFIILNFCGLQKYTQLFLQKEANEDIQQSIINIEDGDLYSEEDNIKQCEISTVKDNLNNDDNE